MHKLFIYPISIIRLILLFVYSFILVFFGLIIWYLSGKNIRFGQSISYMWGNGALWLLNIHVTYEGEKPKDGGIIMSNHQGYLDIFTLLAQGRYSIIAKEEIGKWPVIGRAADMIHMILVNRRSAASMMKVMKTLEKELKDGNNIILFPEGKTHTGNKTAPFKRGSFKVATDLGVPINPVAIIYHNPKDAWTGSATFVPHFLNQMGKWRTNLTVAFGQPVQSDDLTTLMTMTKEAIDSLIAANTSSSKK
ncbi:1-acyl-sn-glycerol-3-phosphate acyltransferase [Halosquirtibacter xylanolyticus]|uniref:lysophospholipid acyltransferase family protein n=1 Tax=Halosquirtibacter xylanolyticus TaxID=3374599 RepID=UPI0037481831|nr:1-acyl-sn-glycerol-3-phosphate acyltransferase [Prolixibacteraceae bacterium]